MSDTLTVTVVENKVEVTEQSPALTLSVNTTTVVVDGGGSIEVTQPAANQLQVSQTPAQVTVTQQSGASIELVDGQGPKGDPAPARLFFTTQAGATQGTLTPHADAKQTENFMQLNNPDIAQEVFEVFIWSP